MGLVIRVSYAVGEQTVELPERTVQAPIIIGRHGQADVQVPSANISRRHCALFVHNGQWLVQDAGSTTGTFLNGQPVTAPTPLHPGDVITLGREPAPPVIEVAPLGVAATPLVPPVADASQAWEPMAPSPAMPQQAPLVVDDAQTEDVIPGSAIDSGWEISPPATQRYYVPKRGVPPQYITLGVMLSLLLLGASAWVVYQMRDRLAPPPTAQKPAAPALPTTAPGSESQPQIVDSGPIGPGSRVFSMETTAPSVPTQRVARPAPQPADLPDVDDAEVDEDAATADAPEQSPAPQAAQQPDVVLAEDEEDFSDDPEWLDLLEMHRMGDNPVAAIVRYVDYRNVHPDSPRLAQVEGFIETALDRIWWQRIRELSQARRKAQQDIQKLTRDIAQERSPQFRQKLQAERKTLEEAEQEYDRLLKEMFFTSDVPLDIYDEQRIAQLRAERDPKYYEAWKKNTFNHIRRTRGGSLPWRSVN